MKIGLIADPHGATLDVSCRTRRPSLSRAKLTEAMAAFAGCDAVIVLGDLVDDCGTREENAAYLRDTAELLRSFGLPVYCLLGNHDCLNFTKEAFYAISGFAPVPFCVELGGHALIFLDACFASDGSPYSPAGIDWTDAFVPREQVDRLREVLAECSSAYVFVHQCLDPGLERRHIIRNAEAVRAVIRESGKVAAVYQGHYHAGMESVVDGIPYHTLPAMVEGEGNSFRVIEIVDRSGTANA